MIAKAIQICSCFIICDKTYSLIIWSWLIVFKDTKFLSPKNNTWTDSSGKPLNWKCTHTTWREMLDLPWADLCNPFCNCLKKRDSHQKENSYITNFPWLFFLAPTLGPFSRTYWSYYRSPLGAGALHSLFLYSDTTPPLSNWRRLVLNRNFSCKIL